MLQKFRKFVAQNNLIKPGDRILIAVSGGIDSMVMTHLLMQSECFIGIAHCNFSLRASESDKDEEMVYKFAADNKIPFFSIRFDTKTYALKHGISIQMAARELRYNWFEKIRSEFGYNSIAVAHNMNDNVETLLINLIRGTGITGLTGMRPSANFIIRPLLFATRSEIIKYCRLRMITYREDLSNADTKYLRNKIRHQIIPLLREINPSIEATLRDTAGIFSGINEIVDEYIEAMRGRISEQKNDYITFNISSLKEYIHNRAVLFELFRPYGIGEVTITDLINIIKGKTGGQLFTHSHRIIKNREQLLVAALRDGDKRKWIISNQDDFAAIPGIESVRMAEITDSFILPEGPPDVCIDSDKLSYPLVLRKWKAGDSFYPLGFDHRKKLSDYFIDHKYSIYDKDNSMILESDGEIVCIMGDRIDNRFRITATSRKALIIRGRPEGHS